MESVLSQDKIHLNSYLLQEFDNDKYSRPISPAPTNLESGHFTISNDNCNKGNIFDTSAAMKNTYMTHPRLFKSNVYRGRWSSPADFYIACTGLSFGTMAFSESPIYGLMFGGVYFIVAYIISLALYDVPFFGIQTFLGQFSSSGTISAFRIAPLFKGFGYTILLLNLYCLSYSAVLTSLPLMYAGYSLLYIVPWTSCNNKWNTVSCSNHSSYDLDATEKPHASVEFFRLFI